jgi:prevent-host-death family protein
MAHRKRAEFKNIRTSIRTMITRIPLTKARDELGKLVKRVNEDKEYIVLEREGEAKAVIMDIDEFEDYLDRNDPTIQSTIAESRREHEQGKARPARELLTKLREKES